MTLAEWLLSIAQDLGDAPDNGGPLSYEAWSVERLREAAHEGRQTINRVYRRKEAAAVLDIPVGAGEIHDLSAHGAVVVRVLGVLSGGKMLQALDTSTNTRRDWSALWPAEVPPTPAWAPTTFAVQRLKGSDTIVQVQPAIPTADSYALRVLMHGVAPEAWTLTSCVDTYPYLGALRAYVQASALAAQVESTAALNASSEHMKRFVALMGATKQADAEVAREAQ